MDGNDDVDNGEDKKGDHDGVGSSTSEDEQFLFGEIKFIGSSKTKKVKVMKVTDDDDVPRDPSEEELDNIADDLLNKMRNKWKLGEGRVEKLGDTRKNKDTKSPKRPKLLISVLGGAWNFPYSGHVKEVFQKGIVEAAVSANAWIITCGTNVGVSKYVGTAVANYELAKQKDIITIGITTWGTLRRDHREEMERVVKVCSTRQLYGRYPCVLPSSDWLTTLFQADVRHYSNVVMSGNHGEQAKLTIRKANENGVFLDPNHSYFILIDDGKHTFGIGQKVKESFQRKVCSTWKVPNNREIDIPMVSITIEGGEGTFHAAMRALQGRHPHPLVIVAHSGRASNWMSSVVRNLEQNESNREDEQPPKRLRFINQTDESDFKREVKAEGKRHFVKVIGETPNERVDQLILKHAMSAQKYQGLLQLELTQTWNRSDIIDYNGCIESITYGSDDTQKYAEDEERFKYILQKCLTNNQHRIVKMFLDNNIVPFDSFLNKELLASLYKAVETCETSREYVMDRIKNIGIQSQLCWKKEPKDDEQTNREAREETNRPAEVARNKDEEATLELERVETILKSLTMDSFELLNDDHKIGYDRYQTLSDKKKYQFVLPPIKKDMDEIIFRVKANSAASIALSEENRVKRGMYEIYLGVGNDKAKGKIVHGDKVGKRSKQSGYKFQKTWTAKASKLRQQDREKDASSEEEEIPNEYVIYVHEGEKATFKRREENNYASIHVRKEGNEPGGNVTTKKMNIGQKEYMESSTTEADAERRCNKCLKGCIQLCTPFICTCCPCGREKVSLESRHILTKKGGELDKANFTTFYISMGGKGLTVQRNGQAGNLGMAVGRVGEEPILECPEFDRNKFRHIGFRTDARVTGDWEFSSFEYDEYKEDGKHEPPNDEGFDYKKYNFQLPKIARDRSMITFRVNGEGPAYIALAEENCMLVKNAASGRKKTCFEIEIVDTKAKVAVSTRRPQDKGYTKVDPSEAPVPVQVITTDFRHYYIKHGKDDNGKYCIEIGLVTRKPFKKYSYTNSSDIRIKFIGFSSGRYEGVWKFSSYEFLDGDILPDPHRQLFLFSLLNKYYEMAQYLWAEGDEHIAAALTASRIYKEMAPKENRETRETMLKQAKTYEELAYDILSKIEDQSVKDDSSIILTRTSPKWGYANHLHLAENAQSLSFISHPAVQRLLDKIWYHGEPDDKENKSDESVKGVFGRFTNPSPKTKFWLHTMMNVIFLVYFSWVMVSGELIKETLSPHELFLFFWVITLICEEIRELMLPNIDMSSKLTTKGNTGKFNRLYAYVHNMWNYIDNTMLLLFVFGEVLQWFSRDLQGTGRIMFAFSLFTFYIRFLQSFTVFRNTGTKILMIFYSLADFGSMVLIFVTILIGYGVAVQGVLFPHVNDFVSTFKGVIFRPLFQIFGELFLDDLRATESDGSCNNDTIEITINGDAPCPQNSAWGLVFLVIYVILCNILLLNIFIAMFSGAVEIIQDKSNLHWSFQYYRMTMQFFNKPRLPPPFIIIEHVWLLLRTVCRSRGRRIYNKDLNAVKLEEDLNAVKLEEWCSYNYIRRKQTEKSDNSIERVLVQLKDIEKRIKQIENPDVDDPMSMLY